MRKHVWVTSEGSSYSRFAEERSNVATSPRQPRMRPASYETVSLSDALDLVRLYAERGSPKYERAAVRWLERYLVEGTPRLQETAATAAMLVELQAR